MQGFTGVSARGKEDLEIGDIVLHRGFYWLVVYEAAFCRIVIQKTEQDEEAGSDVIALGDFPPESTENELKYLWKKETHRQYIGKSLQTHPLPQTPTLF